MKISYTGHSSPDGKNMNGSTSRRIRAAIYFGLLLLLFLFWRSLPGPLFHDPVSSVLYDRNGNLLGAKISADQQWRFPEGGIVPAKFAEAVIHFEDRYFMYHPGFDPGALLRAAFLNLKNHRIVSGGSTITMQVVRLMRKNRERTYFEKVVEIYLAFRLEFSCSKTEILQLYAAHAPFGGNVVGLDAAAWRYFATDSEHLSWADAATLAVLPNSPGLIYPGRNPRSLLEKRNRLLDVLHRRGIIDASSCDLAKSEPLPGKPYPLPQEAPHLLGRAVAEGFQGTRLSTTLDLQLQKQVNGILEMHSGRLAANAIHNAAALVVEVSSGKVLAYVGNIPGTTGREHGGSVDIIRSPRSTGSILKPILYAAMLNDGLILPNTLVPDIPMQIGGFIPENYNLSYDGAVPAKMALARSLNIPAVKMLQTYGYEQFYSLLRKTGLNTLTKPAGHYGLSIILGGAEASLWDLTGLYASMARTLNNYNRHGSGYDKSDFHPPVYQTKSITPQKTFHDRSSWFDAGSLWLTFEAMVEVARPDEEMQWQQFSNAHKIAWKTGTSFGNRDAWSIGVTPEYVVGVWIGNASGEGRTGLTGIGAAAPVLFDIYKILPSTTWFAKPDDAMMKVQVCRYSGYRTTAICEFADSVWIQKAGARTIPCPYHQLIHLDQTGQWQVNSACESPENMQHVAWFVLPPVMEWYFRNKNPFYQVLPPFRPGCPGNPDRKNMEIIYPKNNSRIYIPVELNGIPGSTVFKVAHRNASALVYWHLDDLFQGTTMQIHQMALAPSPGIHRLTLVDQSGESMTIRFEVIGNR